MHGASNLLGAGGGSSLRMLDALVYPDYDN